MENIPVLPLQAIFAPFIEVAKDTRFTPSRHWQCLNLRCYCRAAEKLVLGESNVSTAGVQDIEQANLIAYEMILKYGFSKRLGPLALMVGTTGYLGENSQSISDMGPDLSSTALVDVQEVSLNPC